MAPLLAVESSTKHFGGLLANREVSLAIEAGEIVGLIGPNGAGKTTLFNCISGSMHPETGRIVFDGTDITRARPERICHLGVARTWQVVRAFGRMRARELLEFTELRGKDNMPAATLTLADKKRLEIARALATRPKLLLLDEAMSGLTPMETAAAVRLVRRIHAELRVTICVVEHVMEVVMPLSHRVVVLDYGIKIADGAPQAVVRDEQVIRAYLGERRAARWPARSAGCPPCLRRR